MSGELLERVRETIIAHRLLPRQARVVVGVSGGADSVALLHALIRLAPEWRWTLSAAHLDHGLRQESVEDAAFVQTLGARWAVPVVAERRDVRAICAREGWSLEDGARKIRYEFLLEAATRVSATHLAMAHTADDQAETVLMRLIRGAGLMGLRGIPLTRQVDGCVIARPFLSVWRREILAYLRAAELEHREDATNTDRRFLRNRIRHELLPLLARDYNPNITAALVQLAEQSGGDYAYLQDAASRQWKRLARVVSGPRRRPAEAASSAPARSPEVVISVPRFLRQPNAIQRQLVRQAVQHLRGDSGGLEFRHWREVAQLFTDRPTGTLVHLPGGVQLLRDRDSVIGQRR